jgi:hypothetical protein
MNPLMQSLFKVMVKLLLAVILPLITEPAETELPG